MNATGWYRDVLESVWEGGVYVCEGVRRRCQKEEEIDAWEQGWWIRDLIEGCVGKEGVQGLGSFRKGSRLMVYERKRKG